jgi:hypothetical protein
MSADASPLLHYVLKPPGGVTRFTVPAAGVRRRDGSALVYDVRVGEDAFLRHYSFCDRWFEVNVSLDGAGRLVTEATGPGGFAWAVNCDIDTPLVDAGPAAVARVDLFIDVLAAADGRAYVVKDEEEFAGAVAAGVLTPEEARGALAGLTELRGILDGPGLLAFLESVHPLPDADELRGLPPAVPPESCPLDRSPFAAGAVRRFTPRGAARRVETR